MKKVIWNFEIYVFWTDYLVNNNNNNNDNNNENLVVVDYEADGLSSAPCAHFGYKQSKQQ